MEGNCRSYAGKSDVEAARIKLAEAMLSVVREGVSDVEALKTNALQVMARDYRTGQG